jgi:hypothetical protein
MLVDDQLMLTELPDSATRASGKYGQRTEKKRDCAGDVSKIAKSNRARAQTRE